MALFANVLSPPLPSPHKSGLEISNPMDLFPQEELEDHHMGQKDPIGIPDCKLEIAFLGHPYSDFL